MTCSGPHGDYQCEGWRTRAASIRKRDHHRCRDCGRRGRLHVHHIRYGYPGRVCGQCVLTNISDWDLITLCETCHDIRHHRVSPSMTGLRPKAVKRLIRAAAMVLILITLLSYI